MIDYTNKTLPEDIDEKIRRAIVYKYDVSTNVYDHAPEFICESENADTIVGVEFAIVKLVRASLERILLIRETVLRHVGPNGEIIPYSREVCDRPIDMCEDTRKSVIVLMREWSFLLSTLSQFISMSGDLVDKLDIDYINLAQALSNAQKSKKEE